MKTSQKYKLFIHNTTFSYFLLGQQYFKFHFVSYQNNTNQHILQYPSNSDKSIFSKIH